MRARAVISRNCKVKSSLVSSESFKKGCGNSFSLGPTNPNSKSAFSLKMPTQKVLYSQDGHPLLQIHCFPKLNTKTRHDVKPVTIQVLTNSPFCLVVTIGDYHSTYHQPHVYYRFFPQSVHGILMTLPVQTVFWSKFSVFY